MNKKSLPPKNPIFNVGKRYTITWYSNVIKIYSRVLALGICENTNCVSHIAVYYPNKPVGDMFLKTIIIQDVFANDDCEDARFCINLDCPLNRTDLAYWRKLGIRTLDHLQKMHEMVEKAKVELKLEVKEHGKQYHFEKPPLRLRKIP